MNRLLASLPHWRSNRKLLVLCCAAQRVSLSGNLPLQFKAWRESAVCQREALVIKQFRQIPCRFPTHTQEKLNLL